MTVRKTLAVGAAMLVAALVVAQVVPYAPHRRSPDRTSEPAWDSPRTRALADRACFDCHSAETRWPWYASVAPVSWVVRHHVDEGRDALDLSRWDTAPGAEAHEAAEAVLEGTMPPGYYLALHPEARLTDEETAALLAGLEATIGHAPDDET